MKFRHCTTLILLVVLLAARLLDVHFHLPPKGATESAHVVALVLIEPHRHAGSVDHGHLAGHLYEGEADEDQGAGLLAKVASGSMVLFLPVLFGLLLLTWRTAVSLPVLARVDDDPPRPRRWSRLAPPSQAPPLQA